MCFSHVALGLPAARPVCVCVCPSAGEPVVRAGGFYGQHGDLRLGGGGQAGQQQEHPKT